MKNIAPLRFGVITDIHYTLDGSIATEPLAAAIRTCFARWQQRGITQVLHLGDCIRGDEQFKYEELRQVLALLQEFQGEMFHVAGNHCLLMPRQELLAALSLQSTFYSFAMQGFRFIVLDGLDVSLFNPPQDVDDAALLAHYLQHPELHDYCGAIGKMQQVWLQQELTAAEELGEAVLILSHLPLLSEVSAEPYGLLWNHQAIAALLTSSPAVKACLSGHYHHGAYAVHNGVHFLTLPAFSHHAQHPLALGMVLELEPSMLRVYNQHNEVVYCCALR